MKTITMLLAVPLCLASCVSQPIQNAITTERLDELKASPNLSAKTVEITASLYEDGKITAMPTVVTKVGKPVNVVMGRDFIYPITFDLAATTKARGENRVSVIPTTPTAFDARTIGAEIEITPRIRGPFMELTGKLLRTSHRGFGSAGGEVFSPIVDSTGRVILTENRVQLPHFSTDEYRVHAVGLPGKEQIISFDGIELRITCRVKR